MPYGCHRVYTYVRHLTLRREMTKGWTWTPLSFTRAHHALPFYPFGNTTPYAVCLYTWREFHYASSSPTRLSLLGTAIAVPLMHLSVCLSVLRYPSPNILVKRVANKNTILHRLVSFTKYSKLCGWATTLQHNTSNYKVVQTLRWFWCQVGSSIRVVQLS
jgi:hypothetical protein